MFKNLYNIATLEVSLKPESALLIKGIEAFDPISPDMTFIKQTTPKGEIIFIPGSSIKGVIRSFSESILKSLNPPRFPEICDASDPKKMCPKKYKTQNEDKLPYERHCLVCRTFGSTDLASRVEFSDFIPKENLTKYLVERPGVSIDRKKGTVKVGPFQMEILTQGTFYGSITFTNYQLWQIGLVLLTLQLMDEGIIKLGYGKSRGPGWVHPKINKALIRQFGPLYNKPVSGVGMVKVEQHRNLLAYGKDTIDFDVPHKSNGLWTEYNIPIEIWNEFSQKIKEHFSQVFGGNSS